MLHCTVEAGTPQAKVVIALRQPAVDSTEGYRFTLDFGAKHVTPS